MEDLYNFWNKRYEFYTILIIIIKTQSMLYIPF